MIDHFTTIFNTIKDKILKLRFLADNDSCGFRKIMTAIIIRDMIDWADYLDDEDSAKKLIGILDNYLVDNTEFILQDIDPYDYVNVNLPLTNDTYKRVWDDPETKKYSCNSVVDGIYYACSSYLDQVIPIDNEYLQYKTIENIVIDNIYYAVNNATGNILNPAGTVNNNIYSIN